MGGAEAAGTTSLLDRCVVLGNRITADQAYGAGVYSDGGGIYMSNGKLALGLAGNPDISMRMQWITTVVYRLSEDQVGTVRPAGGALGDVGAFEVP